MSANRRVNICRMCGEPRQRQSGDLTYCTTATCYERGRVFVLPPADRPRSKPPATPRAPSPVVAGEPRTMEELFAQLACVLLLLAAAIVAALTYGGLL